MRRTRIFQNIAKCPFLKKTTFYLLLFSRLGNSTEPLLNVNLKAPFLFGWDDVQGCHLTFVREVLLTLCAPVRSKVVIIFLTIIHSEDTVLFIFEPVSKPCGKTKEEGIRWPLSRGAFGPKERINMLCPSSLEGAPLPYCQKRPGSIGERWKTSTYARNAPGK